VQIIPVTADRLEAAAAVMGRAFADDPMMWWSLGHDPDDHAGFVTRTAAYFRVINTANVEAGTMWETSDGLGAAIWLPPELTATFLEDDLVIRPLVAELTHDAGARYDAFWDWLDTFIPSEPVWYLDQIGVDPERQGVGVGAALITHGLVMADAAGHPAFLETGNPRNVAYYERFGFEVVEAAEAPDGGPRIWFMRRGAQG
jgi:ribosomal protein S18 acetylase RimI-like enzyme